MFNWSQTIRLIRLLAGAVGFTLLVAYFPVLFECKFTRTTMKHLQLYPSRSRSWHDMQNQENVKKFKYWIWGVTAIWLVFDIVWYVTMVPRSYEGSAESYLAIVFVPLMWCVELVMFRVLYSLYRFRPARLSVSLGQIICIYGGGFFALLLVVFKLVSIAIAIINEAGAVTFPFAHHFIMVAGASYFSLSSRSRQVER